MPVKVFVGSREEYKIDVPDRRTCGARITSLAFAFDRGIECVRRIPREVADNTFEVRRLTINGMATPLDTLRLVFFGLVGLTIG